MAGYTYSTLSERIKLLKDFNVKITLEIVDTMQKKLAVSADAADRYQQSLIDKAIGYK